MLFSDIRLCTNFDLKTVQKVSHERTAVSGNPRFRHHLDGIKLIALAQVKRQSFEIVKLWVLAVYQTSIVILYLARR